MAPTKKQLLQDECKHLGLSSSGTVLNLTERIDNHKKSKLISSEDEHLMCDAILVTKSTVGEDDDMKTEAKEAFEKELQKEELEVDRVRGEVCVGNRRGLNLAGMKAKLDMHESKIDLLETRTKDLESEAKELRARVTTLSLAAQDYKQVRRRFISTFKRVKLPDQMEESDYDIIRDGNSIAHGGDAAVDALLYEGIGGRKDIYAFQQLYGLHPSDVRRITHHETLSVLDIHAGVRADERKTGTDEFYQKFADFILAFQKSNLNTDFLIGESANPTRAAYGALLKCQKYKDGE
ncbi:unnamed protein product [Tuber aestivum]|uniref:SAP domain-containing protein n=1 Tax=Tuber aestivum TaxID=59557 RepID=A0A292PKD7_9PEZI|nr:unnamed protein product [Tuber aestivum]